MGCDHIGSTVTMSGSVDSESESIVVSFSSRSGGGEGAGGDHSSVATVSSTVLGGKMNDLNHDSNNEATNENLLVDTPVVEESSCSTKATAEESLIDVEKTHRLEQRRRGSSSSSSSAPETPVLHPDSDSSSLTPEPQAIRSGTPIYNPFSNYSPSRPTRRRMSVALFSYGDRRSSKIEAPTPKPYCFTSDDAFEAYAQQIRAELRYAEMLELAQEAERAAESGQERFAARPCTYESDNASGDAIEVHSLQSTPVTRPQDKAKPQIIHLRSYSEGTKLNARLSTSTQRRGMGVLALREVHEVFPAFGEFHKHLRTHFARYQVDRSTLVFSETPKLSLMLGVERRLSFGGSSGGFDLGMSSAHSNSKLVGTKQRGPQKQQYGGHDLFRWVRSVGQSDDEKRNAAKEDSLNNSPKSRVGELLSGHIHTPPANQNPKRRPQAAVPPQGLDSPVTERQHRERLLEGAEHRSSTFQMTKTEDVVAGHSHRPPTNQKTSRQPQVTERLHKTPLLEGAKRRSNSSQTAETEDTSTSSLENEDARATPLPTDASPKTPILPRALFDADHASGSNSANKEQHSCFDIPITPDQTQDKLNQADRNSFDNNVEVNVVGPDFVTPARLRDIRSSNNYSGKLPDKVDLILQSNSVLDSPHLRKKIFSPTLDQPLLDIDEAMRESDSRDSSLLIPIQLSRDSGFDTFQQLARKPSDGGLSYISQTLDLSMQSSSGDLLLNAPQIPEADEVSVLKNAKEPNCDDDRRHFFEEPLSPEGGARQQSRHVVLSASAGDPTNSTVGVCDTQTQVLKHSRLLPLKSDFVPPVLKESASIIANAEGCSCLSPSSHLDNVEFPSSTNLNGKNDGPLTSPCSPFPNSADRRLDEPRGGWDVFSSNGLNENHPNPEERPSSISGAFQFLSRLSPTRHMFQTKKRLYARSKDNDAFIKNYLYCSKPKDGEDEDVKPQTDGLCAAEPCRDAKSACDDYMPNFCCAASVVLNDTALDFVPRRVGSNRTFVSLGSPSQHADADNLFDRATEMFDSIVERLMGGSSRSGDGQWRNITFQAPTLKKGPSTTTPLMETIAEKKSDEELDYYAPREPDNAKHSRHSIPHQRQPPSYQGTLPPHPSVPDTSNMHTLYAMLRHRLWALSSSKLSNHHHHHALKVSRTVDDNESRKRRAKELFWSQSLSTLSPADNLDPDEIEVTASIENEVVTSVTF